MMQLLEAKFPKGAKDKGRKVGNPKVFFGAKPVICKVTSKFSVALDACNPSVESPTIYIKECKIVSCHKFYFEENSQNALERI